MRLPTDSPVDQALKAGPRGNGQWPGFDSVYSHIARACDKMGLSHNVQCSDDHVDTMADLGSGDEERMKYRLGWLRIYGWL